MERLKREHVKLLKGLQQPRGITELYEAFLLYEIDRISGDWVDIYPLQPFEEIWPGYDPENEKPLYFVAILTPAGGRIMER